MKYIDITKKNSYDEYSIITEDDLMKAFIADPTVNHSAEAFRLWKATHTDPSFVNVPDYIPFDENGNNPVMPQKYECYDLIATIQSAATMRDQIDKNLDAMNSEVEGSYETACDAEWTISFKRDGKEFSITLPWLAHTYDFMTATISELIENAIENY